MDQEKLNAIALNEFKTSLKKKKKYGNDGVEFKGYAEYEAYGKKISDSLEIILIVGGFDPKVSLDIYEKSSIITSQKYHMNFKALNANSQFYFNAQNNILTIKGNSEKMGKHVLEIWEI